MENTVENKAKFFAQYWGQRVLSVKQSDGGRDKWVVDGDVLNEIKGFKNDYLELKTLSQITDEDSIEVGKIITKGITLPINFNLTLHGRLYVGDFKKQSYKDSVLEVVDFLRSKSYSLPYMDLSVENMIEYGWIKLTNI